MHSDDDQLQAPRANRTVNSIGLVDWAKIERARLMTPDERIQEGLRLFEEHCERRRQAIRQANPSLSDDQIEVWLAAELDEERRWEKEPMLEMGLTP